MGEDQVFWGVSVPCWLAASLVNVKLSKFLFLFYDLFFEFVNTFMILSIFF